LGGWVFVLQFGSNFLYLAMSSIFHKPRQKKSICYKFHNKKNQFKFVLKDQFKTLITCDICSVAAANLLAAPLRRFFNLDHGDVEAEDTVCSEDGFGSDMDISDVEVYFALTFP
jgi:hypothetical protein